MSTLPVALNSSVPGPIIVSNKNGELNDLELKRFLQQVVVGVTTMPGEMVRPRWYDEPTNMPDYGMDWASIGAVKRTRDVFAFEGVATQTGYGAGGFGDSDEASGFGGLGHVVIRQQILEILLSFYGPNSESYTEMFAMGMSLAQNREVFTANGMGLVEVEEDSVVVPELINARWVYRVDTRFRVRRSQKYEYQVLSISAAGIVVYIDTPPSSYPVPPRIPEGEN